MRLAAMSVLAIAFTLAGACQSDPFNEQTQEQDMKDLQTGAAGLFDNTFWVISSLRGVDIPTRADCGIAFNEQGQATGRSGVNNFFSQTTTGSDDALTFGLIGSTKKAGPEADMEFEQAFFEMLQDTRRFALLEGGQKLAFYNDSGATIATFRRQVSMAPGT